MVLTPESPDIPQALQQNFVDVAIAATAAGGGEFVRGCDISWVVNRPFWPSYLLAPSFGPLDVDGIQDLGQRIMARELPPFMVIGPNHWSVELGEVLEDGGFIEGTRKDAAMALDLDSLDVTPTGPQHFEVRTVDCEQGAVEWAQINNNVNPSMFARLIDDHRLRLFTGYHSGTPVATSMLFLESGVAGLHHVFVVEPLRRQGFGTAITVAALEAARGAGYRAAVLSASPSGEPIYRRLGFEGNDPILVETAQAPIVTF